MTGQEPDEIEIYTRSLSIKPKKSIENKDETPVSNYSASKADGIK